LGGIDYQSYKDINLRTRRVSPLGLLSGVRVYLIALPDEHERPETLVDDSFERPVDFDIHEYVAKSFDVCQNEENYCDVIWRFLPEAAAKAKS
jgi:hypothetical protein